MQTPQNFKPLTQEEMQQYLNNIPEKTVPSFNMNRDMLKQTYESIGKQMFKDFMRTTAIITDKDGYQFLKQHG